MFATVIFVLFKAFDPMHISWWWIIIPIVLDDAASRKKENSGK